MFCIIYFEGGGVCSALYTRKHKFGGDLIRIIYLKGDVFRIFFLIGDFNSDQPILHFVIVTYDFIYLTNLIGQK